MIQTDTLPEIKYMQVSETIRYTATICGILKKCPNMQVLHCSCNVRAARLFHSLTLGMKAMQ